ncbi:MAG: ABC transporter ATP-binding protein [Planctomycetota bacterium]|nr:ABC transporter ATP-binding protein [Planctomycetota bacterium]
MIEIKDLLFRFGNVGFALRIPHLQIESGERVAIVGPSGSGKTTLLNLLAGIQTPTSGCIQVAETEVSQLNDAARRAFRISRIGLVFQEFELIEYLSVFENILLPFRINRRLRLDADATESAASLVQATGLGELTQRFPKQLSQGERQRASLCRALVHRPPVVLADEPTGNLDPANKQSVLDMLLQRTRDANATLIMVTHDHSLLNRFDRVVDFAELNASWNAAVC